MIEALLISMIIIGVVSITRRMLVNHYYSITRIISKNSKFSEQCQEMNAQHIEIPARPLRIPPPKPKYQSFTYTYPYDEHDYFSYDVLKDENSRKDKAVVIVPFMAGHSKSSCIRRCAQ